MAAEEGRTSRFEHDIGSGTERGNSMQERYAEFVPSHANLTFLPASVAIASKTKGGLRSLRVRPNPSIERTRSGSALQAFISFSALRTLPARAA